MVGGEPLRLLTGFVFGGHQVSAFSLVGGPGPEYRLREDGRGWWWYRCRPLANSDRVIARWSHPSTTPFSRGREQIPEACNKTAFAQSHFTREYPELFLAQSNPKSRPDKIR